MSQENPYRTVTFIDIGAIENDERYAKAMDSARKAAINADISASPEGRDSWARTAQAWIAIAREIRETKTS